MSVVTVGYEHIIIDKSGVPIIAGTSMKVVELVVERQAYGWSPEEIQFQHPYLNMGQIYSALAYYWDHINELEQDINRRLQGIEHLTHKINRRSPLVERLKSKGLL